LKVFAPPGGEVASGETPSEAIVRELLQEFGWTSGHDYDFKGSPAVPGSPTGFLAYEEHDAGAKGYHMNFAFLIRAYTRTIMPCGSFDEIRWVMSIDELGPGVDVPVNVRALVRMALL
jgi:ADP-ribose pyrophosphatase YjhB (NUDIX family)